jgi:hypothetical protein
LEIKTYQGIRSGAFRNPWGEPQSTPHFFTSLLLHLFTSSPLPLFPSSPLPHHK